MQFSDPRKMSIFDSMSNPYDLDEFASKCETQGLKIRGTALEYAQKIGMVMYEKNRFQDKSSFEAYMLLVSGGDDRKFDGPEGCCGGSVVR